MLHKLRDIMGKRDSEYELSGIIELDEGFFSTNRSDIEKEKPLKRGRGSQKKSKVLVMVESIPVEELTKKGKQRKVGYIKMIVIDDLAADTITPIVNANLSKTSIINSDNSTSYVQLNEIGMIHIPETIPKEQINEMLPWVHLAISNAKKILLDIHHSIDPSYLQGYLNEFCYKFNRRYFGEKLFDRLLIACASYQNES